MPWPRALLALLLSATPAAAFQRPASAAPCPEPERRYCEEVERLSADPAVQRALRHLEATDSVALRDLIELTQIEAPPFQEERRGRRYAEMLREAGADSVWTDEVGNVIALRRGRSGGRVVALAGHLDTVFPEGTDVTVRIRGDTLFAPGVGDDTRGLIVVQHVLKAMATADLRTEADLLFIGTVGEEGLGDLRGVKHLFRPGGPKIDAFIAIDGSDDTQIVHEALGSRRYRVTFRGPGGHSWGAFGTAHPAHALGRAMYHFEGLADPFTSRGALTSYSVGRIGGGTSVNSVPFDAWMEVDMRSQSQDRLQQIDSLFQSAVQRALDEQNRLRRRNEALTVEVELVGDRPGGSTAATSPLVLRAIAATRHFGVAPRLNQSSTDANVPIAQGIPAITVSGGGIGGEAHAPGEWWVHSNAPEAIQRTLLLILAEGGLGGERLSGR